MNGFEFLSKKWLGVVLVATTALTGCDTVNVLQGITASDSPSIRVGVEKLFILEGRGTCQSVTVDWGDGTIERGVVPVPGQRIELETTHVETRHLMHAYAG